MPNLKNHQSYTLLGSPVFGGYFSDNVNLLFSINFLMIQDRNYAPINHMGHMGILRVRNTTAAR